MQASPRVAITEREALGQSGSPLETSPGFYQTVAQTTHAAVVAKDPRWLGHVAASTSFWPSTNRSGAVRLSFRRHPFGQCLRAT
jgi:hypothetical protein